MDNNNQIAVPANIPVEGLICKVTANALESGIAEYLTNNGFTGVCDVTLHVRGFGTNHVQPLLYAFFKKNSNVGSFGKNSRIPEYLKGKMDRDTRVHISDETKTKLIGVANPKNMNYGVTPEGDIFIELDIFRSLGIILDASYQKHKLTIFEINTVDDQIVMAVIKQLRQKTSFKCGKNNTRTDFIEKQGRRY